MDFYYSVDLAKSSHKECVEMLATCNVCGGMLVPYYSSVCDSLTSERFAIYRCNQCGLGKTEPQPKDLGLYYLPMYYGNRHGFTLNHCIRRRLGFVMSVFPEVTGRRLLDIGCGDGSFLLAAKNVGWKIAGTELNLKPAQEVGIEVTDDCAKLPAASFDCITMWHTLEHMGDIRFMLAQTARLLKPEGRLLIALPDFGGLQAMLFRDRWLHLDVPRHIYHFDKGSLRYSLEIAGYSIQRCWHQELEYDLLGWSQSALNYILPHPNLFFNVITGKPSSGGTITKVTGLFLGGTLTLLALPLLVLGTLMGRGGSLIVDASRNVAALAGKGDNKFDL